MSLFIGSLAFANAPMLLDMAKIGILAGSLVAGLAGWTILRLARRETPCSGDLQLPEPMDRASAAAVGNAPGTKQ
jgi:NhaA family Na+:H+ antiporter